MFSAGPPPPSFFPPLSCTRQMLHTSLLHTTPPLVPTRPIQRFWVLETVARIPYFAYISILHLYESLGLWRAGADLRRVHFAEEYNELHHLQVSALVVQLLHTSQLVASSFSRPSRAARIPFYTAAHAAVKRESGTKDVAQDCCSRFDGQRAAYLVQLRLTPDVSLQQLSGHLIGC